MNFLDHPLALWGIVALVGIVAVMFGAIALTTGLFTAVGVAVMVVGLAMLFRPGQSALGVGIIIAGALLWLGQDLVPTLTIGKAASWMGVGL